MAGNVNSLNELELENDTNNLLDYEIGGGDFNSTKVSCYFKILEQ
jgi:hypothetical protein